MKVGTWRILGALGLGATLVVAGAARTSGAQTEAGFDAIVVEDQAQEGEAQEDESREDEAREDEAPEGGESVGPVENLARRQVERARRQLNDALQRRRVQDEETEQALRARIEALHEHLLQAQQQLAELAQAREASAAQSALERAQRALREAELNRAVQQYDLLREHRVAVSKYWIGVHTTELSDETREELGLDADAQGIVVASIIEDSPAHAAGFQEGDVIIKAGDQGIETVGDLISFISEGEGQPFVATVVRDGEPMEIEVTPAERPADFAFPEIEEDFDMEGAVPLEGGRLLWGHDLGMREDLPIPEGFRLSVVREGDAPAVISVSVGDDTYEVTQDELDELPEDVRQLVHQSLRGLAGEGTRFGFHWGPGGERDMRLFDLSGLEAAGQLQRLRELAPGVFKIQPGEFRIQPLNEGGEGRGWRWRIQRAEGQGDAAGEEDEIELQFEIAEDEVAEDEVAEEPSDDVHAEIEELRRQIRELRELLEGRQER